MTRSNIEALRELIEKATPGPWVDRYDVGTGWLVGPGTGDAVARKLKPRDAALITALRNAAPNLLRLAEIGANFCEVHIQDGDEFGVLAREGSEIGRKLGEGS